MSIGKIGFIGLGLMGLPIAQNLLKHEIPMVVWNRSQDKAEQFAKENHLVSQAVDVNSVFEQSELVFMMLFNSQAIDTVLKRGTTKFTDMVTGKTIVSFSSVPPEYSVLLAKDIEDAGGVYIEAPVSGSQQPAKTGTLAIMLAGNPTAAEALRPLLKPLCRDSIYCGTHGSALKMKLSVNLYLNSMLVALSESMNFAQRQSLDLHAFAKVIEAGPMACAVTQVKIPKIAQRDFTPQAAMLDALTNSQMIQQEAIKRGIPIPLLDQSIQLYAKAVEVGLSDQDMVAVSHVYRSGHV